MQITLQNYEFFLVFASFFLKNAIFLQFFRELFGQFKKKQYLCSRFRKESRDSVAQQVEHIPFKDGVLGSSPS